MEYIEGILTIVRDNQLLVFGLAILATFLESFIPALPLVGIVITNAAFLGFYGGIISSVIGSCLGTIMLFLLARKFSNLKFIQKLQNEKTLKVSAWIRTQNYLVLFVCYSCIVIPSCLVSISSGFSGRTLSSFVPGMVLGKLTMFTVASFVGYDIIGLIDHPERIVIVLIIVTSSFIVGKKISNNMYSEAV